LLITPVTMPDELKSLRFQYTERFHDSR
jgi:hypothetical protein